MQSRKRPSAPPPGSAAAAGTWHMPAAHAIITMATMKGQSVVLSGTDTCSKVASWRGQTEQLVPDQLVLVHVS